MFKLQKRAARILTGAAYLEHTEPLFKQLQWNTLHENLKFHKCILVYKALNGKTPSYIRDKLLFTRPTTRSLLYVPKPKVDIYRNSFSYSGPFSWNRLPESVRLATSLDTFKRCYWKHKHWFWKMVMFLYTVFLTVFIISYLYLYILWIFYFQGQNVN